MCVLKLKCLLLLHAQGSHTNSGAVSVASSTASSSGSRGSGASAHGPDEIILVADESRGGLPAGGGVAGTLRAELDSLASLHSAAVSTSASALALADGAAFDNRPLAAHQQPKSLMTSSLRGRAASSDGGVNGAVGGGRGSSTGGDADGAPPLAAVGGAGAAGSQSSGHRRGRHHSLGSSLPGMHHAATSPEEQLGGGSSRVAGKSKHGSYSTFSQTGKSGSRRVQ